MTEVMKMTNVTEVVEVVEVEKVVEAPAVPAVVEVSEVPEDWDLAYDDEGCRVQPNYFYDLPLELQHYIMGRFVHPMQLHRAVCDMVCMHREVLTPANWLELRAELDHENQIERTRDCRPRDMTLTEHITLDLEQFEQHLIGAFEYAHDCWGHEWREERAEMLATLEYMLSYHQYVPFDELKVEHIHYCHLDGGVKTPGCGGLYYLPSHTLPDEQHHERPVPSPASRLLPLDLALSSTDHEQEMHFNETVYTSELYDHDIYCFNSRRWLSAASVARPRYPSEYWEGYLMIGCGPAFLCQCGGCSRMTKPVIARLVAENSAEASLNEQERERRHEDRMRKVRVHHHRDHEPYDHHGSWKSAGEWDRGE